MPPFPSNATGLNYATYPAGPTAIGSTVTADASNNVKGAYTELTASSAFECNRIKFIAPGLSATVVRFLFDLATGAGGGETVIIGNIAAEGTSTGAATYGRGVYPFDLEIAASTRIAVRCQCTTGGTTANVAITLIAAGDSQGPTTYTTYGADTSDSGATAVDPGGTVDTKGSYVELASSTSALIQFLALIVTYGHGGVPALLESWCFDLATGAGGGETVLIPDLRFGQAATGISSAPILQPRSYGMRSYIAASTRVATRCSSTNNSAGARVLDAQLIGGTAQ